MRLRNPELNLRMHALLSFEADYAPESFLARSYLYNWARFARAQWRRGRLMMAVQSRSSGAKDEGPFSAASVFRAISPTTPRLCDSEWTST